MNIKLVLKVFAAMSAIFFCGINVSAQVSAGGAAIMAVDERAIGASGIGATTRGKAVNPANPSVSTSKSSNTSSKRASTQNKSSKKTTLKKATPKTPTPKYDGFVIGGDDFFFNNEIVQFVQPIHTIKAQEEGAKGLVQVEILIDLDGKVLQARARSGNKLLHPEAEKAALMTEF